MFFIKKTLCNLNTKKKYSFKNVTTLITTEINITTFFTYIPSNYKSNWNNLECENPPATSNGDWRETFSYVTGRFFTDETVVYYCESTYVLEDSEQAVLKCGSDGKWPRPPKCVPS